MVDTKVSGSLSETFSAVKAENGGMSSVKRAVVASLSSSPTPVHEK